MGARRVELVEYQRREFERGEIPEPAARLLHRDYGSQVAVEPPSFKTGDKWWLTAQGWVGHIPLSPQMSLALRPKTSLDNLFRMLEYAYRQELRWLDGRIACSTLEEFYERLANVLAQRVLDRARKGFYRAYVPEAERLPFVRERLDLPRLVRIPWDTRLLCHYHEHTPDIEDNRLLAWTLFCIARSGLCTERVLPMVRKAYRGLQMVVELQPFGPVACAGHRYHRLNEDYQPMHDLCRFFLEHSGPSHESGYRNMMPFLIEMDRLYERFVAQWLMKNLPPELRLSIQEHVKIDPAGEFECRMDIVLYDHPTRKPRFVLETKYKVPDKPDISDVFQVNSYAALKGCQEAVLIFPVRLSNPLEATIKDIRIRSLTFGLAGDLDQAGQTFLTEMLGTRPARATAFS